MLTYQVQVPEQLYEYASNLLDIAGWFTNVLLYLYWDEEVIRAIYEHKGKAWRFFSDNDFARGFCYVPSRMRRCILETVGEVLRGQYVRMKLFYAMLGPMKDDESGLCMADEKHLHFAVTIRRNILNFVRRHGRWPEKFTELGRPELKSRYLTFTPDDSQAIILRLEGDELVVRIKLPLTRRPTRGEWRWFEFRAKMPERARELLSSGGRLRKPRLREICVKSGVRKYVLDIVVELPPVERSGTDIFVAVDLGVRKLATMVAMNGRGEQLTRPVFVKPRLLGKLLRLRRKASALQSKLAKLPKCSRRYAHLYAEWKRCWNKARHVLYQMKHHASLLVVRFALMMDASTIVFENLHGYEPPSKCGDLSWLLTATFFRSLAAYVEYKARRYGIRVEWVSPKGTSTYCPRCGARGYHIKSPRSLRRYDAGGFFYCPACGYRADRDYVGALNIGRAFLNGGRVPKLGKGSRYKPLPSPTGSRSSVGALPSGYTRTAPVSIKPWPATTCSGEDGGQGSPLVHKGSRSPNKMERCVADGREGRAHLRGRHGHGVGGRRDRIGPALVSG